MTGQLIGNYEIEGEIGRGFYSTVYKAYDQRDGRVVAVKLLRLPALPNEKVMEIYQEEIQGILTMKIPLVVPVHEYFQQETDLVIIMQYMSGGSLADRLQKGPLTFDESFGILAVLAPMLDLVHEHKQFHGDIKPENILFDENNQPFLSDFGMYRLAKAVVDHQKKKGLAGPVAYASPEQLLADQTVDGRSDIYMLGTVLYEMLSGKAPYSDATPFEQAASRLILLPPALSIQNPELPAGIDAVIRCALDREPSLRFTHCCQMVDALEQPEQQPGLAEDKTLPSLIPEYERPEPKFTSYDRPKEKKKVQRFRAGCFFLAWILIALLAYLAISGFWILLRVPYKGLLDPLFATPLAHAPTETARPLLPTLTPMPTLAPTSTPTILPTLPAPSATPMLQSSATPAGLILNNVQVPEVLTSDFFIQELLTCFDIAGRFNVGYQKLVDLNPLVNCQGAGVRPGIRIKIPAEPSYTYTLATAPLDPFGIANLELKIKLDSVGEPRAVDFSPLGDLLAVASGNDIFLWRIGEWKPYRQLRGHLAAVNDIVFSMDGKLIASASNDTSVRVWDVINGTTLNIFYGHEKPVTGVAFDPDRVNLASVSIDGSLRYWNLNTGTTSLGRLDPAYSVAYSPDGAYVAVGMENKLRVYPAGKTSWLYDQDTIGIVRSVTFSADSKLLATNTDIWHVQTEGLLYELRASENGVAFAPDSQTLIYGKDLIMLTNGEKVGTLDMPLARVDRVDVDVSDDGRLVVLAGRNGVFIWGFPLGYQKAVIPETREYIVGDKDTMFNIAFDAMVRLSALRVLNNLECEDPIFPEQHLLIPQNESANVQVYNQALDLITADNIARIQEIINYEDTCIKTLSEFVFSNDSQFLIGGSVLWQVYSGAAIIEAADVPRKLDGEPDLELFSPILSLSSDNQTLMIRNGSVVELWNTKTGRLEHVFTEHKDFVTAINFSTSGTLVASAGSLKDARIWTRNLSEDNPRQPLENRIARQVFFTADEQSILFATEDAVNLWKIGEVESEQITTIEGSIILSPDRSQFAFIRCLRYFGRTCQESVVVSYEISRRSEQIFHAFTDLVQALNYSPDGRFLAGGSDNYVTIWDLKSGKAVQTLPVTDSRAAIVKIVFSPDSQMVATIDAKGVLRIWQIINSLELYSSKDSALAPVVRVAFSPDRKLLAVQVDQSVRLYGVPK